MRFIVECQVNANDDRRFVPIVAESAQQASREADRVIRVESSNDPQIRGCIVVGVVESK